MESKVVQATFENIDFAEDAIRNIKHQTTLSDHSISLLKQNHARKTKIILPIRPLSNSDLDEQMHSNLLPIIEVDGPKTSGECQLRLSLPAKDAKAVSGRLYNLHGYHVSMF
ncbi:MAG: hypothetical protein E7471_00255 [Ruminococcaceae bacterium]|nr:hypothetical protein [Oscillospiraceae bacterium]